MIVREVCQRTFLMLYRELAQHIFYNAFNNAHEEHGNEKQAFKIAWLAVERSYKKDKDGKWVQK